MKFRFLLPALLSIMMNSTMAATNNKFVDHAISELSITDGGKGSFVLTNITRDRTLIGIGVVHDFGSEYVTTLFDGVGYRLNVGPGETIDISPGRLRITKTQEGVDADMSGPLTQAGIAFVVFDDGTFYGTKEWQTTLETRARYRQKFLNEAAASKDPAAFMKAEDERFKTHQWGQLSADELTVRRSALSDWHALNQVMDQKIDVFLKTHREQSNRFPKLKVRRYLDALKAIAPADAADGWYAYNWALNCFNGTPFWQGSNANDRHMPDHPGFGCKFPNPEDLPIPTGYTAFSTYYGTRSTMAVECTLHDAFGNPRNSNYLHDGFITAKTRVGSDPLFGTYAARERVSARLDANFYINAAGPDTFFADYLVGVFEPFLPTANLDFGTSHCSVVWQMRNPPFLFLQTDDLRTGDPVAGSGPLWVLKSTGPFYYTGANAYYGYVMINRKATFYCNQAYGRLIEAYPGIVAKQGPASADGEVYCYHTPPPAPTGDDGGGECDPQDWCCCMWETAGNYYDCLGRGIWPADYCPTSGSAAPDYITTGATVGGSGTADAAQLTQLGVFRNNDTAGGSWLTDPTGYGAYDPAVTRERTSFVIPGGVQSTDKAVAGDWTGIGHASIGFYRPSTGQWFLDANGNGVWDGPAGGDYLYVFGGVQPTGTPGQPGYVPGDVPVVGDWYGNGRDCVGLFRWGHTWITDTNCNGSWDGVGYINSDSQFEFGGVPGDVPIVAKWKLPRGNQAGGTNSTVGVIRCYVPPGGTQCQGAPFYWILDVAAVYENQFVHGVAQGPIGCGISQTLQALYGFANCDTPAPFAFGGLPGDVYVVGDWNGDNRARPGVYRSGQWVLSLNDDRSVISTFWFGGLPFDTPLPAKW